MAGKLVTAPSHSPENSFFLPNGQRSMFTYAATMDIEIIHDLFTNCIEAIDVLAADAPGGKFDAEFRAELAAALKRLPPLQISKRTGALAGVDRGLRRAGTAAPPCLAHVRAAPRPHDHAARHAGTGRGPAEDP